MPIKLIYFNVRGRAEAIRYVLAQAGVDYDDVRVDRAEWRAIKSTMPMGQIPVVEVDGHTLCQSAAIGRYFARKHHLTGVGDISAALCDMYVDGVQDVAAKFRPTTIAYFAGDTAKMKEQMDGILKDTMPDFLRNYEKFLADNGTGWLVGKQVTWADLYLGELLSRLSEPGLMPGLLDNYPHLTTLVDNVHTLPAIKAWVVKRPETGF